MDSVSPDTRLAEFNKILIDKDSGIHIIYSAEKDGNMILKYAYKNPQGQWIISSIPETENVYVDYWAPQGGVDAILTSTHIYVIYVDDENNTRVHISKKALSAGTWQDEIFSTNFADRYPKLFVDNNENIHIYYAKANNGQYYALYGGIKTEISSISDRAGV